MYLHVGGNEVVAISDIVMILDETCMVKGLGNTDFLRAFQDRGSLQKIGKGPISSWIITKKKVIGSPISSSTLRKRANQLEEGRFDT